MNSFYSPEELRQLGFASVGMDVYVSKKASIYGAGNMILGDHVRIDDFCILSGKITIGNYVHVSSHAALFGGSAGITMEDYSGVSTRCTVYAATDDYSGAFMSNAMAPAETRNVQEVPVNIGKYCQIGAHSVVLPGVSIGEGAALGAMSLANHDVEAWTIQVGAPCHFLKEREKGLLKYVE